MDSLDDIAEQVETLLSNLSSSPAETASLRQTGWRYFDWEKTDTVVKEMTLPTAYKVASKSDLLPSSRLPSPVEKVLVRDRVVYVKRDDLVRLPGSGVSGNKARKMYALNEISPQDFPSCVVSYGGPQSNAMVALAAIVHSKNEQTRRRQAADSDAEGTPHLGDTKTTKRFVYFTKTLPRFLRNQPSGNLFRAQTLGMELVELSHAEYNHLFGSDSGGRPEPPVSLPPPVPGDSLWVPQGGACGVAVPGGRMLAEEIVTFWSEESHGRPLTVCVPGGTCTTALILHREIKRIVSQMADKQNLDIRVVVIPCVGDDTYARRQMMALSLETGGTGDESEIPTDLTPAPLGDPYFGQPRNDQQGYFTFGEPDAEILQTFQSMEKECNVNLDLLYGAPAWTVMLRHWRTRLSPDASSSFDERNPLAGREIMYVHSGGLEGVTSQLARYRYKGLVELNDIQCPTRK